MAPIEPESPPRLNYKKAAFRLGMSLVLLTIVFSIVGGADVQKALSNTRPGPWALALLAFLGLHSISALKWRFFLGLCGAHIGKQIAIRSYGAGLFANLCLPSLVGGDVLRAGLAIRASEHKEAVLLGSVVDRFCDILALGLLVSMGFLLAPSAAEQVKDGKLATIAVFVVLLCGAAGGLLALRLLLGRVRKRKVPRKLAKMVLKMRRAAMTLRSAPLKAIFGLSLCLFLQAGFVVVNIGLGAMMGLDMDPRLWFLLWPLAKIAAMVPVSLGGLGVREAAFAALVKPFHDSSLAIAESLLWQSVLIVGGLIAGAYWLLSKPKS